MIGLVLAAGAGYVFCASIWPVSIAEGYGAVFLNWPWLLAYLVLLATWAGGPVILLVLGLIQLIRHARHRWWSAACWLVLLVAGAAIGATGCAAATAGCATTGAAAAFAPGTVSLVPSLSFVEGSRPLARASSATVAAGVTTNSGAGSPITVLRGSSAASKVSTVDNADLVIGQSVASRVHGNEGIINSPICGALKCTWSHYFLAHPALCGRQVSCGFRQSIPSSI